MTDWMYALFLMSVQGAVLIAALLVLRRCYEKRMSPTVLYALWLLPAVRLLVPGSVASVFSFWNIVSPATQQRVSQTLAGPVAAAPADMPAAAPAQGVTAAAAPLDPVPVLENITGGTAAPAWNVAMILTAVWLVGAAAVLLFATWKNFTFVRRARRDAVRIEAECPLPVYLSEHISSPCLCGIFRPVVLVNDQTLQSDVALELSLRHELGHYRAGDRFWALLRLACCAVHWFNPLVWIAAKVSVQDCERSCDYRVLQGVDQSAREAYGALLLSYLKQPPARYSLLCATSPMGGGKRSLRDRIALIGKKPTTKKAAVVTLAACVCVTCLVACTGRVSGSEEIYLQMAQQAENTEQVSVAGTDLDTVSGKTLAGFLNSVQWTALEEDSDISGTIVVHYRIDGSMSENTRQEDTASLVIVRDDEGLYYAHVFLQDATGIDTADAWYEISEQEANSAWAISQISKSSTLHSELPDGGEIVMVCSGPAMGSEWHDFFRSENCVDYTYVESNLDELYPRVAEQLYFVNDKLGFVSFRYEVINGLQPPHLYRTEDGGKTWARVELPMMDATVDSGYGGIHVTEIAFDYAEDKAEEKVGRITVGLTYGGQDLSCMFTTTDGGKTWSGITSGGPDQSVDDTAVELPAYRSLMTAINDVIESFTCQEIEEQYVIGFTVPESCACPENLVISVFGDDEQGGRQYFWNGQGWEVGKTYSFAISQKDYQKYEAYDGIYLRIEYQEDDPSYPYPGIYEEGIRPLIESEPGGLGLAY